MPTAPKTPTNITVEVHDTPHAPFIFIDEAPSFGNPGGHINITVAAYRHVPDGNGAIKSDLVVTAHLRWTIAGAMALRDSLDKAILMGAKPEGEKPN